MRPRELIRDSLPAPALRLLRGLRRRFRFWTRRDVSRPSDFFDDFERHYGEFQTQASFDELTVWGLPGESGGIRGSIVEFAGRLPVPESVLLPGEYSASKAAYAELLGVSPGAITTAGLADDVDYVWDFEEDPPAELGSFDLSISEAMLEHLIDPYGHVEDLASLTNPGGHIILATHPPGFPYHRYPVDCVRFWPDWFEEVADRIGFVVRERHVDNAVIDYVLQRPEGPSVGR